MDYDGVAAKVKDYVRACFVVTTFAELCCVWDAVEDLKEQGKLKVMDLREGTWIPCQARTGPRRLNAG